MIGDVEVWKGYLTMRQPLLSCTNLGLNALGTWTPSVYSSNSKRMLPEMMLLRMWWCC